MTWAVVPAAGRGERAGGTRPKQYADLAGKPMLQWTLEALLSHRAIRGAMVVLAAGDTDWPGWTTLVGKPLRTAVGAGDRAGSVRAGLAALADACGADDWVLVHDAARPGLLSDDLDRLLAHGCAHAVGAVLALPVADTLKRANAAGEAMDTPPREHYWRAQTPQLFRYGALCDALDAAARAGVVVTDESAAFERLGQHPLLVPGSAGNFKVTTADDLALAATLLARRAAAS